MTSYTPTKMSSKENLAAEETAAVPTTPDTVILHQYPRNQFGPTLSPFALKLETYLRLAKITYANDFSKPQSSKGKTPWITYKNQDIADSSMCIEFLKTNVAGTPDLNAHLSASEKAVARAFQKMLEEEFSWVLALWRWNFDKDHTTAKSLQAGKIKEYLTIKIVRGKCQTAANGQGIGRHSQPEIMKMGEDDIRAVGEFLGTKTYFMGESVSDVDATVFGLFGQLLLICETCPLTAFARENYPNLVEYVARIKDEVWPDWEDICQSVRPAEKEKKPLKQSLSTATTPTTAVVNGNGHHHDAGKSNGITGPRSDVTAVIVTEPDLFKPIATANNAMLIQEIESTFVNGDNAPEHGKVSQMVNGGDHGSNLTGSGHHHPATNGDVFHTGHSHVDNGAISHVHVETHSHMANGDTISDSATFTDSSYGGGDSGAVSVRCD